MSKASTPAKPFAIPTLAPSKLRPRREGKASRDLIDMLRTGRPANTIYTARFGARWLGTLGAREDSMGNWLLRIPHADGTPSTTMWSSHIDTVHWKGGDQHITLTTSGVIKLHSKEAAHCLGADCTTGAWLMREMALARVPGLYIWHEGEEIGGIGSRHIANFRPDTFAGILHAVAFDRADTVDVITHQAGGRCCSDDFAVSLAKQLPGQYKPCTGGVFTDTANYTKLVGECTNISVGYDHQHSSREVQDAVFAMELRAKLLTIDEKQFVVSRKPGEYESLYGGRYGRYYQGADYGWAGYDSDWDYFRPASRSNQVGSGYSSYSGSGVADLRQKYAERKQAEVAKAKEGSTTRPENAGVVTEFVSGKLLVRTGRTSLSDVEVASRIPKFKDVTRTCGGFCGGKCVGFCRKDYDEQRLVFKRLTGSSDGAQDTFRKLWSDDGRTVYEYERVIPGASPEQPKQKTLLLEGPGEIVKSLDNLPQDEAGHPHDLRELVRSYPAAVADWLEQQGYDMTGLVSDLSDEVADFLEREGADVDDLSRRLIGRG